MDGCQAILAKVSAPIVRGVACCLRRRRHRPFPTQAAVESRPIPETAKADLDRFFEELQEGARDYAEYDWSARALLARTCIEPMLAIHEEAAAAGGAHKGTTETGLGEELLAFGAAFAVLRQFADSFDHKGKPPIRGTRAISAEKMAVRVFPGSLYEHLLFPGWAGEVWVHGAERGFSQGSKICQRVQEKSARVQVQLAAGNQAIVVVSDILETVFGQGSACLVKMNPVNEYLGPILEKGFAPLVSRRLLRFVYGPLPVATECINHAAADELHMTGSDKTYNMIQWGSPNGPSPGKVMNINKPFTAELGACTPYMFCPGRWSETKLRDYARSIVSMKSHNSGCNCLSPQILVTSRSWPQRDLFLDLLRAEFRKVAPRTPWYPGAVDRLRKVVAENPQVEVFPDPGEQPAEAEGGSAPLLTTDTTGCFPWLFIPDVQTSPASSSFRNEFFSGALMEVCLESDGHADFLPAAVEFANSSLWGTLSCALFAPPSVPRAEVEQAVADLKYGSVNVNTVTAMGYFLSPCTWGGYAGHTPEDIQSGIGIIHNTMFFDNVEKSVVWAPCGSLPYTPFWYYTHANTEALGRCLGPFYAFGDICSFVKTVFAGLRG